ncbi:unnamed protein product [Discula destructiva]
MTDSKQPTGPDGGVHYPPPPGPPPGQNGLGLHPNEHPLPDSHSELYDNISINNTAASSGALPTQQTAHQPPPVYNDDGPKKTNWAQRFSAIGSKAAAPFNMLATKLGAETFLPSTMDKECDKAARILRNFCKDGIYTDTQAPDTVEVPTVDADGKPVTAPAKPRKNRTLLTIPSSVISKAVGLAIFTTARAGFHVSGATGSGVIIARLPDGSWSPPSGIQVHSVGAGFMIGIDIYDCVVVINTREALEAFTKTRMSLGSDLAVVAGPWGAGGSVDFAAPQGKGKEKAATAAPTADEGTCSKAADTAAPSVVDDHVHDVKDSSKAHTDEPAVEDPPRRLGEYSSWGGSSKKSTPTASAARPDAAPRKPSAIKQAMSQPTYSYVKSRGFYAGVQVDGTIVTERKDANTAFYGEPVSVQQILKGEVPLVPGKEMWVELVKTLFDTVKGAEGQHAQTSFPSGAGATSEWANQTSPDLGSVYGTTYGGDHVYEKGENPPPKPPRPTTDGVTDGVKNMSLNNDGGAGSSSVADAAPSSAPTETPGARAKAAEAAAEAEMNREREELERRELAGVADPRASTATAPPGYTEMMGADETANTERLGVVGEDGPPAYVDDGVPKPGVGDAKGPAPQS